MRGQARHGGMPRPVRTRATALPHLERRLLFLFFAAALLSLLLVAPARAVVPNADPVAGDWPVAVNDSVKVCPATDGEWAVWAQAREDVWIIYSARLEAVRKGADGAEEATPVVTLDSQPSGLQVSSGVLVYQVGEAPESSVWMVDLRDAGDPVCLADGGAAEPAISGVFVVWADFSHDPAGDIAGYCLETPDLGAAPVCADPGAQRRPAIGDGLVAWQDDRNGTWDVYGCYIDGEGAWPGDSAGKRLTPRCEVIGIQPSAEFPVGKAEGDQTDPAVWGGIVVWQDERSGNADIWAAWAADSVGTWRAPARCEPGEFKIETGPVCTAAGDQIDPTIAGPVVFWEDRADGAEQANIRGYDFTSRELVTACAADGAQTSPSAGGESIVWLDRRNGSGVADVYGTDLWSWKNDDNDDDQPPCTDEWTDEEIITLFLSVFDELGVFQDVCFSIDGGETYSDWQPLSDVVDLPLPETQGTYALSILFRDGSGNEFGPVTVVVHLDKQAPVAKALGTSVVHRGKRVWLRYKVRDNMSPTADVTIRIKNARGAVVRVLKTADVRTGSKLAKRFVCRLPRGKYRYLVSATDLAGNTQKRASVGRLIVR